MTSSKNITQIGLRKVFLFSLLLTLSSFTNIYAQCPTADAGTITSICFGDSFFSTTASATNNTNGVLWSGGAGTWVNPTSLTGAEYIPSQNEWSNEKNVILTLTVFADPATCPGGPDATSSINVSIVDPPTIDPFSSINICSGDNAALNPVITSSYDSVRWETIAGASGTFINPISANTFYQHSQADSINGGANLSIKVYTGNCYAEETVYISINPKPSIIPIADQDVCLPGSVVLSTTVTNWSTITWSSDNGGTFSLQDSETTQFTPANAGTTIVTLTATANGGCSVLDYIVINAIEAPTADAGLNDEVCQGDSYFLGGASVTNEASILWTHNGQGSFSDPTIENPFYTPAGSDFGNVVRLTVTADPNSPCADDATDFMDLTVLTGSDVFAGNDFTICEGESPLLLNGSATNYVTSSVLWVSNNGGTFTDENSLHTEYFPSPAEITAGFADLTLSVEGNATCPGTYLDDLRITITQSPTVEAGPNDESCKNSDYAITGASATNYSSVEWSDNGAGGSFNDANITNAVYTPATGQVGQVTLTLTAYANGSCSDVSDDLILTIADVPSITPIGDQLVCGTYILPTIGGTGLSGNEAYWTASGGTGIRYLAGATVTPQTLYIYDSNGSCSDEESFEIIQATEPTIDAGANDDVCGLLDYALSATATDHDPTSIRWTVLNGNGSIVPSTNSLTPTYQPGVGDLGQAVILQFTVAGQIPCLGDYSDQITLNYHNELTVEAGTTPDLMCQGTHELDATIENESSILWEVIDPPVSNGFFNDPTTEDPTFTPGSLDIANGSVTLRVTASPIAPCTGDQSDIVVLNINETPIINGVVDDEICVSDASYSFSGITVSSGTIQWTGGTGSFNVTNIANPTYYPGLNETGDVVLTITASNPPCADVVENMTLHIQDLPQVDAGDNEWICKDEVLNITTASANNATIEWTSTGTGSFVNANVVNPTYIPSSADYDASSLTLTMTGTAIGPCSGTDVSTMELRFVEEPVIDAGNNDTICEGESYQIVYSSGDPTTYTSIQWEASSGIGAGDGSWPNGQNIAHPTYIPGPNDITNGYVNLSVTAIPLSPCVPDVTSTMRLTIVRAPDAYAGIDIESCYKSAVSLDLSTAEFYSRLEWTTSGNGTFNDSSLLHPIYYPSANDVADQDVILTLKAFPNNHCSNIATSTLNLHLTPNPTVFAGNDATICENGNYYINDALAGNYGNLTWIAVENGNGIGFNDPNDLNPIFTPNSVDISRGYVTLRLTVYGANDCSGNNIYDELTLNIDPLPTINLPARDTICEASIVSLSPTVNNQSSVLWSKNGGDGSFTNTTQANTSYSPGVNDIADGYVILTLTANGDGECGSSVSEDIRVEIFHKPDIEAGPDVEICETGFTVSGASGDPNTYSSILWTSSGEAGTIADPTSLTPTYTPSALDISNGYVYLRLTAIPVTPCLSAVTDSFRVTINELPVVDAGSNATICEGNNYLIPSASAINHNGNIQWSSPDGNGSFLNGTQLNATYVPDPDDIIQGSVRLVLTAQPNPPCSGSVSDELILYFQPLPTVNAGPSTVTICEDETYTANPLVSNESSVLWTKSGTGTFDDATSPDATYTPSAQDISDGSVILTLTATGTSPCSTTESDQIELIINKLPVADAGPASATICDNGTYTTTDATALYQTDVMWTSSGTPGRITNPKDLTNAVYSPSASDVANGSVTLRLTATNGNPCNASDYDDIIIYFTNSPEIITTTPPTLCQGVPYLVNIADTNYASAVVWSKNSAHGTLSNTTSLNPTFTPDDTDAANGSVILTLTAYGMSPCVTPLITSFTFPVAGIPTVDLGEDITVCEGTSSIQLNSTVTNADGGILWTGGDGTFIPNATEPNPLYIPHTNDYTSGIITLRLTATGNATCGTTAYDEIDINFISAPTANVDATAEICANDSYYFASAVAANDSAIAWTHTGNGLLIDANTEKPTYYPDETNDAGQDIIFTMTVHGYGDCDPAVAQLVLSLERLPEAEAGPTAYTCGTSFKINQASVQYNNGLTWETSGDGNFDNDNLINPTYTMGTQDLINGSVALTLTAHANSPCTGTEDKSDSFILHIIDAPQAYAGPTTSICEGQNYVTSSATANGTVLWEVEFGSESASFEDPTDLTTTFYPTADDIAVGYVILKLTATGDASCPDAVSLVRVNIIKEPVVFAGDPVDVCLGTTYQVDDASVLNTTNYIWTTNGEGIFSDADQINPIYEPTIDDITGSNGGIVILTLTATSESPCAGNIAATKTLTIIQEPTAFAGNDDTICIGEDYVIPDASAENYQTLVWSSSSGGVFSNNGDLDPTYHVNQADESQGWVDITLTANPISPCFTPEDHTFRLSILSGPVSDAGASTSICIDDVYTNTDANPSDYTSLLWQTSGDGTFSSDTALHPTYIPGTADKVNGVVTLTLHAYGSGSNSCNHDISELTLTINKLPTANAGSMTEICEGSNLIIGATAANQSSLYWTIVSGTGTLLNANSLTPIYNTSPADVTAGNVILELAALPQAPCTDTAFSSLTLNVIAAPTADAGADTTVCGETPYYLWGATSNSLTNSFAWATSGTGVFSDPNGLNPIYAPSAADVALGAVTLTLTASNGSCNDAIDVMILTLASTTIEAGANAVSCVNANYTANGTITGNYTGITWTENGNGSIISGANTLTPVYQPDATDAGTTITMTMTVTKGAPCSGIVVDAFNLEIKPEPTATLGNDTTICEDEILTIPPGYATATNYTNIFWTTAGDGTFTSGGLTPTYYPGTNDLLVGFVELTMHSENAPCLEATDAMIVNFSRLPVVDAGLNATVDINTSYTVNSATASNYASISWTHNGNGSITSGENTLTPTYLTDDTDLGRNVILTLTAIPNGVCSTPVTDYMIITVGRSPVVDFNATSLCENSDVEFIIDRNITDVGALATYSWNFGDGVSIIDLTYPDVSHTYNVADTYIVTLEVTDTLGYTSIIWKPIEISAGPVAYFDIDPPSCSGLTTQFRDYSQVPTGSGYITEWYWDFGDGTDTTIYHPITNPYVEHTFPNSSSYDVRLTVTTSEGCFSSDAKIVEVTASPIANFIYENTCFDDLTQFTDNSTNVDNIDIVQWEWNFGDPSTGLNDTSTMQNPVHRFLSTGDYPVSLTVTNSRGCSNTVVDTITIDVPPPVDFNYSSACLDTEIQFSVDSTVTTIADISNWLWEFGDGITSTDQNPTHTYLTSGNYTVSLTALNLNGCSNTVSHDLEVYVAPIANFDFIDPTCAEDLVQFIDYSTTPSGTSITEWRYYFGDGDSTIVIPTASADVQHQYDSSGTYTVTLQITNSNGCISTVSKDLTILPSPIANFEYTPACLDEFIQFSDLSTLNGGGSIVSWSWNFGDPATTIDNTSAIQNPIHQFSEAGTFDVILFIQNSQGCTDTISLPVTVRELPTVDFDIAQACLDTVVEFTVNTTVTTVSEIADYFWEFGDGQTSNEQNPTHAYDVDGTYNVTLTVTDTAGCENSASHELSLSALPQSLFGISESQCNSDPILFTNYSTTEFGYITEWYWDFGDGNDTTILHPGNPNTSHLYDLEGTYTVSLTVTNSAGCSHLSTQEVTILPGPVANFDFESVCLNTSATFIDLSQSNEGGRIVSWDWDFGDPNSGIDNFSTLQNPSHIFSTVGSHLVTLTITNENGCVSIDTSTIIISMLPDIDFYTVGGNCLDGSTEFFMDSTLVDATNIQSALWDFGDGFNSNSTQPSHIYATPGTYEITLTIIDLNGCTNSITKNVYIDQLPDVKFDTDAPSCEGLETQFTDLSSRTNFIVKWHWEFGDGSDTTINWPDDQNVMHNYATAGNYLARLTITTSDSCQNTAEKEIVIAPGPIANFAATTVCINHPAEFTDLSQENSGGLIVDWYWDFGDEASGINNNSSQQNPIHSYAESGRYEVVLTITNAEGCSNTYADSVEVTIPPPLDPFTFDDIICMNTEAQFFMSTNVNLADVQTILWDFGDPTSTNNTSSEQNPTHIYETPGEYIVTLTLDNNNCGGFITDTITVNSRPQARFEFENACVGSPTIFTDLSLYSDNTIESWSWDFGIENLLSDTSSLQNPTYVYTETGQHYVSLQVTDIGGCSDIMDSVFIEIFPTPTANFSFVESDMGTIEFTNESTDATIYEWNFGDGWISDEVDPVHQYDTTNSLISSTYEDLELMLVSLNESGCADTAVEYYDLYFKGLFIPTAFSPNNPSEAVRVFKPIGVNLESFEIEVYSSWGDLIWSSSALDENGRPTESWDGTLNGSELPTGAYIWRAKGVFKDGSIWKGNPTAGSSPTTSGTVLLIR